MQQDITQDGDPYIEVSARAHKTDLSATQVAREAQSLFALLGLVKVLTVVIVLLMVAVWYIVDRGRPANRYYAMSFDGRKLEMAGLTDPNLNTNAMLAWVGQAATQIMTFGFSDVAEQFTVSRHYFTDIGWESFYKALNSSSLLKNMMAEQQLMTAIPTDTPKIMWQGFRKGDYVWDIHVPIVLTVRAADVSKSAHPTLIVTVQRVPTQKNPNGLGIQTWTMF